MKSNIFRLASALVVAVACFSCNNKPIQVDAEITDQRLESPIEFVAFLDKTGIKDLRSTSNDWQLFLKNYETVKKQYAGSQFLMSYRQMALNVIVLQSNLLESTDIDPETLLYLCRELNSLKHAYPEPTYKLLEKYMGHHGLTHEVRSIAKNAVKLAERDWEYRKAKYDAVKDDPDRLRGDSFASNYGIYVPKLQELYSI